MSDLKITETQLELIERIGVAHEVSGMQPAASRIMALLLVADRTELSFDEIQQTLGISKSSTSVAINLLLLVNRVEYITKVGDRKRYFRSKILNWEKDMKQNIQKMTDINTLFKEILAQRPKETKEFNNTLADIIDFMEFFQNEIPGIFKKWEEKRK